MTTVTKREHRTPGPWKLHGDGRSVEAIDHKCNIPLTTICIFPHPEFPRDRPNGEFIVRACNAHDDLLAALINLTATARTFRNVPTGDQEWTPIDDEALEAAFAAIAKAEA